VCVPTPPTRAAVIGDAAIALLAQDGPRGLTHRAVDAAAGLPAGSTSYYARTREALLELVMARMVELDAADVANAARGRELDPHDLDVVSARIADQLHATLAKGQVRMIARFEFALEATRRAALRAVYDAAGAQVRQPVLALLRAAGSPAPERHARSLICWYEGTLFDSIAGAGRDKPPTRTELRTNVRELLRGMLGR
jgi:DNA-binding transcriptional regulator YbjK